MSRTLKIMLIDDDPAILLIVSTRLKAEGHEVVTRDKAYGTSAAVVREAPDLVLLDVHMPGLPGEELSEVLTQQGVPVVLFSGDDETQLGELVAKTGALGFIPKAESPERFLNEVRRFGEILAAR